MRGDRPERGGNCICDFTYGQRSTMMSSLFTRDGVFWYGAGVICSVDPSDIE